MNQVLKLIRLIAFILIDQLFNARGQLSQTNVRIARLPRRHFYDTCWSQSSSFCWVTGMFWIRFVCCEGDMSQASCRQPNALAQTSSHSSSDVLYSFQHYLKSAIADRLADVQVILPQLLLHLVLCSLIRVGRDQNLINEFSDKNRTLCHQVESSE